MSTEEAIDKLVNVVQGDPFEEDYFRFQAKQILIRFEDELYEQFREVE